MKQSPIASAIPVTLDRGRTLVMDFNAFVLYREATGEELPDVVMSMFRDKDGKPNVDENGNLRPIVKLSASQTIAMIWAGLKHEDDALTLKFVGRHMTIASMFVLQKAALDSMSGTEEEPADPTPAEATENQNDGTGTKSEPSAKSTLGLVKKKSSGG